MRGSPANTRRVVSGPFASARPRHARNRLVRRPLLRRTGLRTPARTAWAFVLARLIPAAAPGVIAGYSDSRGAFAVRRGESRRVSADAGALTSTGAQRPVPGRMRQAGQSDAGGRELAGGGAGRVGDAMQEAGDDR
jgi:hypothetical protein